MPHFRCGTILRRLGSNSFDLISHQDVKVTTVRGHLLFKRNISAQPEPVLGLEQKQALREKQVQIKPRVTSA